ncbi:hypothetical protein WJX77_005700 [Trebouxia sp. C0004]
MRAWASWSEAALARDDTRSGNSDPYTKTLYCFCEGWPSLKLLGSCSSMFKSTGKQPAPNIDQQYPWLL